MLTAYSIPDTIVIIINNFAFYPGSVGFQCTFPVAKRFFIYAVWQCFQEVYFVWCTKRDQFETENIAEADMKWPPKQQSALSFMFYLSTQTFSIAVCLAVVCTYKHNWLAQLCNTKFILFYKSPILWRILQCNTTYHEHCAVQSLTK